MADIDEDAIHHPSTSSTSHDPSAQVHEDISDETQDFRFINSFSLLSDPTTSQSLPKRGEKDFEPNPTLRQADALAGSRLAMHNAIAYPRLHNPKGRVVGVYCPDGVLVPLRRGTKVEDNQDTTSTVAAAAGGEEEEEEDGVAGKEKQKKPKYGVGGDTCVCVPSPKGGNFKSMGRADQFNRMWLLPEEALYLLERGSLDIRWRVDVGRGSDAAELELDQEAGIPMSLQAAYALFLGRGGLTLERYTVFAGLKRGGYAVVRAPSWDEGTEEQETASAVQESGAAMPLSRPWSTYTITGLFSQLFNWIYNRNSTCNTSRGPVVGLGIHRSYNDIFRALSIVPRHDPTLPISAPPRTTSPYRLAFNVYKPSTSFRKSNPGLPDFQIAVISARDNPTLPPLEHLSALLASTPYCPPQGEKMERLLYMRLRHGYRNVILAVVDQGVVSFLRISDAGFGREKLYAAKATGGNKGGRRPQKKGRR